MSSVLILIMLFLFSPARSVAESGPIPAPVMLPTPRMMEPTGKRFVLNEDTMPTAMILLDSDDGAAALAAREINDRVGALGGRPLPIVTVSDGTTGKSGMSTIILTTSNKGKFSGIPAEAGKALDTVSGKGGQAYVIRFYQAQNGGEAAVLAGIGREGLLHAGSTFRLLLTKEGALIYATQVQIADWPGFRFRGLPVWPLPDSFDAFKPYVDWAFRSKFNRIYTHATAKNTPDGFNLPTADERRYLRKINAYARERGIRINYTLTWAVAAAAPGGKRNDHREALLFNNQYYSWSDDGALQKRAEEIARFVKETEAESLLLHCIDTYEEGWDDRGRNDRARFGSDRASADANVITIFTREIRKANPGIELQFVVYPYQANFDLPGNEHYRTWITRLTGMIPGDVYLTVAELNRSRSDSWAAAVRQPLVHWINGNAFQWGRYFSTLPAFTRTAFTDGRDRDIIIHWEPIGHFNGEVMQLIAAEYAWNPDAPGNSLITEEKTGRSMISGGNLHYRKEVVNGKDLNSWGWFRGTDEPEATAGILLLNACRLEFGEAASPFIAEFFRNNPIGWRSPELFNRLLLENGSGKEWEACSDQRARTGKALASLNKALETDLDSGVRTRLNVLLRNTYHQGMVIAAATGYYQAKRLSAEGKNSEAERELTRSRNELTALQDEMKRRVLWSRESDAWFDMGNRKLNAARAGLENRRTTNRLQNPGFEEAASGGHSLPHWSAIGSVTLTGNSHRGKHAACITLKPSETFVELEQRFAAPAGCDGFIEFWMKRDGDFRVIPILQYRHEGHADKKEQPAVDDFPFTRAREGYTSFSGRFALPEKVTEAAFRIYADWFGFAPIGEKAFCLDDVVVSCDEQE